MATEDKVYKLKVVLLGDMGVGKTSIAVRFTSNSFEGVHRQTIGASFISKNVVVDNNVINYQIWDTAGQERFKALVPMYLRGAHIALVVYDVTDPDSFSNIGGWLEALRHHGDMVKPVIVANKCDLQKEIEDDTAVTLAQDHGIQFVCVSAKTGYNIEKLFHCMGSKAVDDIKRRHSMIQSSQTSPNIKLLNSESDDHTIHVETDKEVKPRKRKCCRT